MKDQKETKGHVRQDVGQESDTHENVLLEDISNRLLKGFLPNEEEYFVRFCM